jgi:ADP-heptose:LPS heptosyltransferase
LELSKRLIAEYPNYSIFWTASPQSSSAIEAFLSTQSDSKIHFFRTASLHELMSLVKGASLVITPDTSVVHIASAFTRPVVALYPVRHEWPPYKTPYRLLIAEREQPVSSIPVENVFEASRELLFTDANFREGMERRNSLVK